MRRDRNHDAVIDSRIRELLDELDSEAGVVRNELGEEDARGILRQLAAAGLIAPRAELERRIEERVRQRVRELGVFEPELID